MSRSSLVCCVLLILSCRPGDFDTVASPIIGGVDDAADPAVVALVVVEGGEVLQSCTGTLIAPKTVLTAAHCILPAGTTEYVVFGPVVPAAVDRNFIEARQRIGHPGFNINNEATDVDDIAVYELAEPTQVTPIALYEQTVTTGQTIRHVGYGTTTPVEGANDGSGRKREVTTTVRRVEGQIEVGAAGRGHCYGDSGGPGLIIPPGETEERVEGVVSWGTDDCLTEAWDTRVDTHLEWIRMTMGAWETTTTPPDAGVEEPDAMTKPPQEQADAGAPDAEMLPDPMDRPMQQPPRVDDDQEGTLRGTLTGGGCRTVTGSIDELLLLLLILAAFSRARP